MKFLKDLGWASLVGLMIGGLYACAVGALSGKPVVPTNQVRTSQLQPAVGAQALQPTVSTQQLQPTISAEQLQPTINGAQLQ